MVEKERERGWVRGRRVMRWGGCIAAVVEENSFRMVEKVGVDAAFIEILALDQRRHV